MLERKREMKNRQTAQDMQINRIAFETRGVFFCWFPYAAPRCIDAFAVFPQPSADRPNLFSLVIRNASVGFAANA